MLQRVFPLISPTQTYAWGRIGEESLVYRLSKSSGNSEGLQSNKPYAELWMGDHVNGPSLAILNDGEKVKLSDIIPKYPEHFLGKDYDGFNKGLPFLFKVLSVNNVLSLQIHPDKPTAEVLNKAFPDIYKDDNHKPEIAIALTEFEAFCNFRPHSEIVSTIEEQPLLKEIIGKECFEKFKALNGKEAENSLRNILKDLLEKNSSEVKLYVEKFIEEIESKTQKSARDTLILRLNQQFPLDLGIILCNFLNYLQLQPGESILMNAGEPHAYIKGDCIECMARSDNVIRGCFTPKLIDRETLLKVVTTKMGKQQLIQCKKLATAETEGFDYTYYPTPYREFECYKILISKSKFSTTTLSYEHPAILIALRGEIIVITKNPQLSEYRIKEGQSALIVPNTEFIISRIGNEADVYVCVSQTL